MAHRPLRRRDMVSVKTAAFGPEKLIATYNEPIRKHEEFPALRIITTPKGEQVIDFGQNLVGWVTVKASGKAGDKISRFTRGSAG